MMLLFSRQVMSHSSWPCGLQHTRLPCPSPSPGVCPFMSIESVMPSNHLILCCPLLLLTSVFPSTGAFPVSQLFKSGGQSIGASTSASFFPKSIQGWFPLILTDLISLLSKGPSRVFSNTTVWMHQFFGTLPFLLFSSHIHTWQLEGP